MQPANSRLHCKRKLVSTYSYCAYSYCQNTASVTQTHLRHWSRVSAALSVECEFSWEGEALLQTHMVRKETGRNKTGAVAKSKASGTTSNKTWL